MSRLFYRPDSLPATQPALSKHWTQRLLCAWWIQKNGSFALWVNKRCHNFVGCWVLSPRDLAVNL